jgi:hypothetical protein
LVALNFTRLPVKPAKKTEKSVKKTGEQAKSLFFMGKDEKNGLIFSHPLKKEKKQIS